jgi:putative hydrolases of HD superfamily
MPKHEMEGLTKFLYEMGLLKRHKRTGWWIAGIDNPESIAEHSFRTAIIGYLLAVMEGADPPERPRSACSTTPKRPALGMYPPSARPTSSPHPSRGDRRPSGRLPG